MATGPAAALLSTLELAGGGLVYLSRQALLAAADDQVGSRRCAAHSSVWPARAASQPELPAEPLLSLRLSRLLPPPALSISRCYPLTAALRFAPCWPGRAWPGC